MSPTEPERIVLEFFYERSGGMKFWKRGEPKRDAAEPWRGACAWHHGGECMEKRASIYVGLDTSADEEGDDPVGEAERLADDLFHRLYPGHKLGWSGG